MDNVNFEAKTDWKQDETVYPEDANRWEKGIKDCADLVNNHNEKIPLMDAETAKKVNKSGDTMSGNLNLNAGLIFGNYRDTAARIQLPGVVEGKYYQIVNNASESESFLQFYDDTSKGVVLIKSTGSHPYYFNGSNPYRLLNSGDAMNALLRPPQLSAGVNITSIFNNNQTYTPTVGGWIYAVSDWTGIANDSYRPFSFYINGVGVADYAWAARDGRDGYGRASAFFWVSKGQVVSQNTNNEAKINVTWSIFMPGVTVS